MLTSLRVLDFSELYPGPLATSLLADLGATVIKVERPGGDPMRGASPQAGGASAQFHALNRGKQSIEIDLRKPGGVDLVREVAGSVDVMIESFRPGVADRLGIGYDAMRAGHQSLVYASLSGYGPWHHRADHAAHDINAISLAGLAQATAGPGEPPRHPATLVADTCLAALTAASVLAAVQRAGTSGVGTRLHLSLLDSALWAAGLHLAATSAGAVVQPGEHVTSGAHAGYGYYACADGQYLSLGALEPHLWRDLVTALGRSDLIADPSGAGEALVGIFRAEPRSHWLALLGPLDLCVTPVLSYRELLDEAVDSDLPNLVLTDGVPGVAAPLLIDGLRPAQRSSAPQMPGQDTVAVLRAAGLSDLEISNALNDGLVSDGRRS